MRLRWLVLALVCGWLVTGAATAQAGIAWTAEEAAWRAVGWLRGRQSADGGFGDASTTVAVLHALGDAGENPSAWRSVQGVSILDYLTLRADEFAQRDAASAGRLVVALAASGQDPRAFAGFSPLSRLQAHYDPTRGVYGGSVGTPLDQAWALLALAAARETAPDGVGAKLLAWQNSDGGWSGASGKSEVEVSALALAALATVGYGPGDPDIGWGTSFLSRSQAQTGGLTRGVGCGCQADARSTARATQAILVVDRDPLTSGWLKPGGSPPDWLRIRQADDGGVPLTPFVQPDTLTTAYAVSALLGRPLAVRGRVPATRSALAWLRPRLMPDGGFAPIGTASDPDFTLDAVFALAALGQTPADWQRPGAPTTLDYLAAHAPRSTAQTLGRLIIGVVALGGDPRRVQSADLLRRLDAFYSADTGAYGTTTLDTVWALLALAAVHRPPPDKAIAYLASRQADDGGWRARDGLPTDTVTTALALQALATAQAQPGAMARGRAYLAQRQQPDGGFAASAQATVSSTMATAAALQALALLGERADGPAWTKHALDARLSALPAWTPPRALLAWQNADGGFRLQSDFAETDPLATVLAVPALAGRWQPLAHEPRQVFLPLITIS